MDKSGETLDMRGHSIEKLLKAEAALLSRNVKTPLGRHLVRPIGKSWAINTLVINGPDDENRVIDPTRSTLVLMHGYGSGLGFFYKNYDALAQIKDPSGNKVQVVAADWLGCGGSSREAYPVRSGAKEDSIVAVQAAEDYFVDSFEEWRATVGLNKFALAGHSLGGYLAAVYAMKFPQRLHSLTLVSPFGMLDHPNNSIPLSTPAISAQLPFVQKMFLAAWNNNITPQWVLRKMGPYGPRMASNVVSRRFPSMNEDDRQLVADYVYHLSTVRPAAGEYALNALMELRAIPLEPEEMDAFSTNDMKSPPTTKFGLFARNPVGLRMFKLLPTALPVAILFGDTDWMFSNRQEMLNLDVIKSRTNSKLFVLSNAGHHLYLDNPEEMHEVFRKFPLWGK